MKKVFLSHSNCDKEFVRKLDASFFGNNIETFLDEKDILIGDSIPESIYNGIDESTHLIYVISENSISSGWVTEELSVAKMREKDNNGFKILPVLIDSSELPTSIRHIKYANFQEWRNPDSFRDAFLSVLISLGIEAKTISQEELHWYANNSKKLKECIHWINKSTYEISGALTSTIGKSKDDNIHYMATKYAFEENMLKKDLENIILLLGNNFSRHSKLYILFEHTKHTLEYINTELPNRYNYKEFKKIEILRKELIILLEIIEQFRNEMETLLLGSVNLRRIPNKA